MASTVKYWWQKVMHWLLGEEGVIELNVEELKAGLQAQKDACTRLLALALQAKQEIEAVEKKKQGLHQEALILLQQNQEDLAIAKSDEEEKVDQEISLAQERYAKLSLEAEQQWKLYQQRAGEVTRRIDQARHLKQQVEVNRLREKAQGILDSSDLTSAMSRFDQTAKGIELAGMMNDARAAVEAELRGPKMLLQRADLVLEQGRRQQRLAALKREALPSGSPSSENVTDGEARQPEPATVEKTI